MFWTEQKFKITLFTSLLVLFGWLFSASPASASSREGTFISQVKDVGYQVAWGTITWNDTVPASTALTMEVRWGNVATPDGSWSAWSSVSKGGSLSAANANQYIQYKATLSSTDAENNVPSLDDVTVTDWRGQIVSSIFNTKNNPNALSALSFSVAEPGTSYINFQIRTSPDNITWSNWCGPDNGTTGCSTTTYFTDPAGGETIDADFTDGSKDMYFQWKAFVYADYNDATTPTLSSVTLGYNTNSFTGVFTSQISDLGAQVAFGNITWTGVTTTDSSVTMEARAGSSADLSDGVWTSFSYGDSLSAFDGSRYVQYRGTFSTYNTYDSSDMPTLNDVAIAYSYYSTSTQFVTSSPYNTEDAFNTIASFTWADGAIDGVSASTTFYLRTADASANLDAASWSSFTSSTSGCAKTGTTISCDITAVPAAMKDGSGDQWVQYKIAFNSIGSATPDISSVTFVYVINAPPTISGSGITASQLSDGTVSINWGAYDSDTGTATTSFQYSLNNGSTWSNVLGHLSVGATTTRSISSWTTSTVIWDVRQSIDGQDVSQFQIRVIENDGEGANFLASTTSASFALDAKDPVLVFPSKIVATTTPATIYNSVTDTNTIQMINSLNSDLSGASWESYATTDTITLSTNPDTVYVQYRDLYFNTTTLQTLITPNTPGNMVIRDISNINTLDYKEFIAWSIVDAPAAGFNRYDIWSSTDGSSYSLVTTITDRATNYYVHSSLTANTTYYYKISAVDNNGSSSYYSAVVSDNADGQGGTDNTSPTITNVSVGSITTQGFTVTWNTDEISSSSVAYFDNATGQSAFATTTSNTMADSSTGFIGQHSVIVTGLTPNTLYNMQIASADPTGNILFDNNSNTWYTATTLDGPRITNTPTADPVGNFSAVITWATDVSSDSTVYYSTSANLSSPSNITSATLTTTHSITLSGLTANTTYYYYVTSGVATANNSGSYYTFTTQGDVTAPIISGISASPVADTTAVVTWTTDESATTQLVYGTTSGSLTNYSTLSSGLDLNHTVSLTGLTANTKYYYTVSSLDGSNNATTSTENNFTTQEVLSTATEVAAAEATATAAGVASAPSGGGGFPYSPSDRIGPVISNIRATGITSESATIAWGTNENGDSIVEFGRDEKYGSAIVNLRNISPLHSISLNSLIPSTKYNYQVSSADTSGNHTYSGNQTFTTQSGFEELDSIQDFAKGTNEDPEVVFKNLISKTADIIRRMSGTVSVDTLETGLAIQYTTISDLGRLVPLPLIGGQPVVEVGATYARVYWTTDKPASSLVAFAPDSTYKNNQEYTQVIGRAFEAVENHDVLLSELKPNTTYHYQVRSKTSVSDTAKTKDFTFTTKNEQAEIITYKIDSVSDNEAIFSWTTNIPTDSKVVYMPYGKDGVLQIDAARQGYDKAVTTLHEVKIKDMEAGLTYQIELSGTDLNGNIISKTLSTFSTSEIDAPPVITQVQTDTALLPGDQTAVQAIVSWITNEPATSQIFYQKGFGRADATKELSQKTPYDPSYIKRHIMVITKFEPGSVYQFQVESTDSSQNTTRSRTYTLLTPRQKESVLQVIMGNLEETFGWVGQLGL